MKENENLKEKTEKDLKMAKRMVLIQKLKYEKLRAKLIRVLKEYEKTAKKLERRDEGNDME